MIASLSMVWGAADDDGDEGDEDVSGSVGVDDEEEEDGSDSVGVEVVRLERAAARR